VRIDGDPGVIELSRGSQEHLVLRAHLPHWQGLIHHVQRARRIFNLDADVARAHEHLREDPLLVPLIDGVRPPGTWDPFETGVRAIVGQQVSVAAANTLMARLVARHGTPIAGLEQLGLTHLFPTADELADAPLEGLGLPVARACAVGAFARAVADGAVELDRSRSLERLSGSIASIDGLGPWTAQYVALRLGEEDAFPFSDLGLRRAIAARRGAAVTAAQAQQLAESWRPHRAHAAAQLWLT
jgi:3-methyladenine DNA glycosylase/8-oxoguanine DNA glycosylase